MFDNLQPQGFFASFVMSSVVNACNSGAHIEDAHKKCSSGGYEGKFGGSRRGCRGKGDEAVWWSWKGHDVDDGDGDVAPEEKVTRSTHSLCLANAAIGIGTQFNVGN